MQLSLGVWNTQVVYATAKIGICDLLADGPHTVEDLASAVGAVPSRLGRLLGAATDFGILSTVGRETYGLGPLGQPLRTDAPDSVRYFAIMNGEEHYQYWGRLLDAVGTEEVVSDQIYGQGAWAHNAAHPESGETFNRAMGDLARNVHAPAVAQFDFSSYSTVMDIGGGTGTRLAGILQGNRHLRGVLLADPPPSAADLRAFLKEHLPAYMVPSHVMLLDRIPMTANGKVDRKALPEPERRREVAAAYEPPRDELESVLCDIWTRALRVDRVGIHDGFFDLGGHSLLAVQVVHELQATRGLRCPVSALLRAPTVAELADLLRTADGTPAPILQTLRAAEAQTLFLFHPAGGEVLAYRPLVEALGTAWSVVGVRSRAVEDPPTEHTTLAAMVDEYVAAVRAHQPEGPYHLAGWSFGGVLAHAAAARLEADGQQVAFLGLVDSALPQLAPELRERLTYRAGATFGSLAGLMLAPAEWEAFTSGVAAVEVVADAHHYSVVQSPHVETIAAGIDRRLAAESTQDG